MAVLVDSSGWIEFVQSGANASIFASALQEPLLIVPTVVAYEVTRFLRREVGDDAADQTLSRMQQCIVADLDLALAVEAARLGIVERLAFADSIILATARRYEATLWTQDAHFEGMASVHYIPTRAH